MEEEKVSKTAALQAISYIIGYLEGGGSFSCNPTLHKPMNIIRDYVARMSDEPV